MSSGQSIAFPNMVLNAAMADSLDSIANELEAATAKGEELNKAVGKLLTKDRQGAQADHLQRQQLRSGVGEGSRQAQAAEPEEHGGRAPTARDQEAVKLLDRFKILNERETHARYEIFLENYNKTINIEGQLMVLMANRYILPAAFEYQKQIGQSVAAVKAAGGKSVQGKKLLGTYTARGPVQSPDRHPGGVARTQRWIGREARELHARQGCPAMAKLREIGDEIEVLTPHEIWPLPTYREMLFVK